MAARRVLVPARGALRQPDACYNLGIFYDQGRGGWRSARRAVHYYQLAADAGIPEAACNLGVHYSEGDGVRRNPELAFHYLKMATDAGDVVAFDSLGDCYRQGMGIRRNFRQAFGWYVRGYLATRHGRVAGNIADCYYHGWGVRKNLRKAFLWSLRSARTGEDYYWFHTGVQLICGEGTPKDSDRGREWLERYLEKYPGDLDTRYWLGKASGWFLAKTHFEEVYTRGKSPHAAWELVKQQRKLLHWADPRTLPDLCKKLRLAERAGILAAIRLARSRRWRDWCAKVLTSEELAARYRASLRWGDGCQKYMAALRWRGSHVELELGMRYLQSPHPWDVITGANILALLGTGRLEFPFAAECIAPLLEKFNVEKNVDARRCLLSAIAWQHQEEGRSLLLSLVDSPDVELRRVVAQGLGGENRAECDALLKLATDPDEEVWDWALFRLIAQDADEAPVYPE